MSFDEDSFEKEFEAEYPDTDLCVYLGPIRRPNDEYFISHLSERKKKKNIMVLMTTAGGDPHSAYRIARGIQNQYGLQAEKDGATSSGSPERCFYLFVDSICVSAGTLVALGATHLILSDNAELGPLDVQLRRPDEPTERDSGLTPSQALTSLERRSKSLFKAHFEQLRNDDSISLTTRTAVENAASIASELMRSIYAQIDPMRLGEVERLLEIAAQYGERLGIFNLKQDTISNLLTSYPSHNFVIDRLEAETLFNNVDPPKEALKGFGKYLRAYANDKLFESKPSYFYWTTESEIDYGENSEAQNDEQNSRQGRKNTAEKGKENGKNGKERTTKA